MAALVHRLSGLALAIFLPLHFLTLGLAIDGEAQLDGFLRWSDQPLVKLAESGLVFLLAGAYVRGAAAAGDRKSRLARWAEAAGDDRSRHIRRHRIHLPRARILRDP